VTSVATPTADQSARGIIQDTLDSYGLGSLGTFAWNEYLAGTPISQILLDIRKTPEYAARFPAMASLAKSGHAITEQQYIDYERTATQLMTAAGLPSGFYDQPDDFAKLLASNISPAELQTRLQSYQQAVYQSPPEVRAALQQYYGVTDGQLTAFFIDPDKALPLIQRDLGAAQAGGTAAQTGYGAITQQQAEGLAALGLTQSQLQGGFGNLANLSQVLNGLPGQGTNPIGTDTALSAQFGGNVAAQQEIEARQADLLDPFKAGGGVATTSQGAVGAGVAR
jgi:hypothetical protein